MILYIGFDGWPRSIPVVFASLKKDIPWSVYGAKWGSALRGACRIISSRKRQMTCVTCEEPKAESAKGSTRRVRYVRGIVLVIVDFTLVKSQKQKIV